MIVLSVSDHTLMGYLVRGTTRRAREWAARLTYSYWEGWGLEEAYWRDGQPMNWRECRKARKLAVAFYAAGQAQAKKEKLLKDAFG